MTGAEALEAFLGRLAARDSSEHTRRAYRTAISQYLDWLDARGADWRNPGRDRCARLPGRAGRSRPVAALDQQPPRRAALLLPLRPARGHGQADPWSAALTPRQPRRLPRCSRVAEVERAASTTRRHGERRRALALRDVAMVETAYAAGLRISELAGARLADLDLGRGELRVLGKGRKERVTLLGGPGARRARHATCARPAGAARRGQRRRRRSGVDLPQLDAARRSASAACAIGSTG